MDDLVSEFITEAAEGLGALDVELVTLEQNPNNPAILGGIFRIIHTIKGTCGFLGLPRLELLSHAAENVLCDLRDGDLQVTPEAVTLILNTLDQLKTIISVLEETGLEPEGDDAGLIAELNAMATPVAQADTELDDDGMIDLGPPAADDHSMIDLGLPAVDDILLETMPPMAVAEAEADTPEIPADTTPDAPPREIAAAAQNIRVSVNLLENLMTMVSELVLTRNQLMQTMRNEQSSAFTGPLQRLNHITSELQEGVMKTRMQPIGKAWNKLPRIVRDLSQELDKQVNLEMFGAETELDRQVLEMIKDPLTHMVRNSCDHGLESGAERLAAGSHCKQPMRVATSSSRFLMMAKGLIWSESKAMCWKRAWPAAQKLMR